MKTDRYNRKTAHQFTVTLSDRTIQRMNKLRQQHKEDQKYDLSTLDSSTGTGKSQSVDEMDEESDFKRMGAIRRKRTRRETVDQQYKENTLYYPTSKRTSEDQHLFTATLSDRTIQRLNELRQDKEDQKYDLSTVDSSTGTGESQSVDEMDEESHFKRMGAIRRKRTRRETLDQQYKENTLDYPTSKRTSEDQHLFTATLSDRTIQRLNELRQQHKEDQKYDLSTLDSSTGTGESQSVDEMDEESSLHTKMMQRFEMNTITDIYHFHKQNNASPDPEVAECARSLIQLFHDNPDFSRQDLTKLNDIMEIFDRHISIDELTRGKICINEQIKTIDLIRYFDIYHSDILETLGIKGLADTMCGQYILHSYPDCGEYISLEDAKAVCETVYGELPGCEYVVKYINDWFDQETGSISRNAIGLLANNPRLIFPKSRERIYNESIDALKNPNFTHLPLIAQFPKLGASKELLDVAIDCTTKELESDREGQRIPDSKIEQLLSVLKIGIYGGNSGLTDRSEEPIDTRRKQIEQNNKIRFYREKLQYCAKLLKWKRAKYLEKDVVPHHEERTHILKLENQRKRGIHKKQR